MARLTRRVALAIAALSAAAGLAACGGGVNADAVAACHGVHRALAAYDRSLHATNAAARAADLLDAQHQIALEMHTAAMANAQDGTYDALVTMMQQAQEVPFRNVAPALRAECSTILSANGGYL